MTEEKDRLLSERYPEIFKDHRRGARETPASFGFDCSDGWFDIIDALCKNIQDHLTHHRARRHMTNEEFEERVQVRAVQVKEKFGGLRFYVSGGDDYVRGAVAVAESMSYRICESCGDKGHRRSGGWVKTLCDKCHLDGKRQDG